MKKKRYLDLYYKWMKAGKLPNDGLCSSLNGDKTLIHLLSPDNADSVTTAAYWGWNGEVRTEEYLNSPFFETVYLFTPLRQNIVLLLACLNEEL